MHIFTYLDVSYGRHLLLYCLCDTHLQPMDMLVDDGPVDTGPGLPAGRRCTSGICHRHMRFLLIIGSPDSLTKKHLMDVGVLSYRMIFQSVSA